MTTTDADDPTTTPTEPPPRHPGRRASDRPPLAGDVGESAHGVDPGLLRGATEDEILRNYLELIRTWRGAKRRATMGLRQADVAVLVSILGTDDAEIERRLMAATKCTPRAARRGRLLLFASVSALSLGMTGVAVAGATTHLHPTPVSAAPQQVTAPATDPTDAAVASPAVVESAASVAPSTDATVVDQAASADATAADATAAPVPVVGDPPSTTPATVPAAVPEATASAVPAGTTAIVTIPSIGIDLPVLDGGQEVIDQGVVAHYFAPGWEAPVPAGSPGTYWLAAHHLSHGGPFDNLPDIAVGAQIRVVSAGHTYVYTVTSKEVVGLLPGDAAVYGTDPSAAVILLQTCVDDIHRVLVHGILTAVE